MLVAGVALAADINEPLNEKARQTLQGARTVGIVIEQGYQGERDEKGKEPQLPGVSLPLANVAIETLAAAGIKCVPTDKARVVLKVGATGRAIGQSYNIIGHRYSGAKLEGSIVVELAGQAILRANYTRTVWPPEMIRENSFQDPSAAPFALVLGGYRQGLLQVVYRVHGAKPLLTALSGPVPEIAAAAADALGEEQTVEALPGLITALTRPGSSNEPVRHAAAIALGRLRQAQALPALITALQEGEEKLPDLEKNTPSRAEFEVFFALSHESLDPKSNRPTTRQCILSAIDAITAPDKTVRLVEALHDNSSVMRRSGAAILLSRAWEDPVEAALTEALRDPSFAVRVAAISALADLPAPSALDAIHALARSDPHPYVRDVAENAPHDCEIYASQGFTLEPLRRLAGELRAVDPQTRFAALGKLSNSGPPGHHHGLLLRAVKDDSPPVRAKAYALLSEWDSNFDDTVGVLMEATRDPDPFARKAAIEELIERPQMFHRLSHEKPEYFDRLMEMLASPEVEMRRAAVTVLGQIDDKRTFEPLLARLHDPDENSAVRRQAVVSLGYQRDPRAMEPLIDWFDQLERETANPNRDAPYAVPPYTLIQEVKGALSGIAELQFTPAADKWTASEWRKWLAQNQGKLPAR